ncbi:hypothetical protein UFOVP671_24 [uncultured Caudovirales phage]|uniref:Uncharacterized protein n=1 Tax=uncultured Caudovirales phage TaxID=2100421 RepID=A0A6J5NDY2_9CAUD|nr:hypothetical protein UFOVP671_24 [uncultured Caudovirales phage]
MDIDELNDGCKQFYKFDGNDIEFNDYLVNLRVEVDKESAGNFCGRHKTLLEFCLNESNDIDETIINPCFSRSAKTGEDLDTLLAEKVKRAIVGDILNGVAKSVIYSNTQARYVIFEFAKGTIGMPLQYNIEFTSSKNESHITIDATATIYPSHEYRCSKNCYVK